MERNDEITTGEAARILGVGHTTLIGYAERGLLPVRVLPSGHRRFRREDVEALRTPSPAEDAEAAS